MNDLGDLGVQADIGILEKRSLNQTNSIQVKLKVREKKTKGPKPNRFHLEMAGSAKGQTKL